MRVEVSDNADLPMPTVATDQVRASPALLALAHLLGRLAAIEEQQAASERESQS